MSELYTKWQDGDMRSEWFVFDAGLHEFSGVSVEFKERVIVKQTKTYSKNHGWNVTPVVDLLSAKPYPLWPVRLWLRMWRRLFNRQRPQLPRAEVRR